MFKKILVLFLFAGVIFSTDAVSRTFAQEDIQISPRVWVIKSNVVNDITIHVAYNYVMAVSEGITLTVEGEKIEVFSPFADSRGDLVIRFTPNMTLYSAGQTGTIVVTIGAFEYSADFSVKELALPAAPDKSDEIVILGGDKVRGEEGVGSVNQNQTEEPKCWDTSWCEPEGSFGE